MRFALWPRANASASRPRFVVNRGLGPFAGPGVTAASASNSREIDVYVALRQGSYPPSQRVLFAQTVGYPTQR